MIPKEKKKQTIEALELVLNVIRNSETVADANFQFESEIDEGVKGVKGGGVWNEKYPTGWVDLVIRLRYKKECSTEAGANND